MTQFSSHERTKTIVTDWLFKLVVICVILLLCFGPIIFYNTNNVVEDGSVLFIPKARDSKWTVETSKCKIPYVDPFDPIIRQLYTPENYTSCTKHPLLTYVTKTDNIATLYIDTKVVPSYTENDVTCCYANITRQKNKAFPDKYINISSCVKFKDNITVPSFVMVKCNDSKSGEPVYENTHASLIVDHSVKMKMDAFNGDMNPFSVLFVGIDGVSNFHLTGNLPVTHQFLVDNDWVSLKGYNKIGDNTFPNVMGILSGFDENQSYANCNPKKVDMLDHCPLIWYDYRKLNYITGYAEDETWMNTFNFNKKGFTEPPTDYYFRPYIMGSEKLKIVKKHNMQYCTGPETAGERIMNIAKDFVFTFKDYPTFSIFWMNSFSHDEYNAPNGMDTKIKAFLEEVSSSSALNNSFVFFLSDHGRRNGDIRRTSVGWLQERLPFIYISIPERFKRQFPTEYRNLLNKRHQLTNPYDLHMTLQHILVLSGLNYTIHPSKACPKCKSFFTETEVDRSCQDAAIEQQWCTCAGYSPISPNNTVVKQASNLIIDTIKEIIHNKSGDSKCAKFDLDKIRVSSTSETFASKGHTYFLLMVETQPKAVYEATVLYRNDSKEEFWLQGEVKWLLRSSKTQCTNDIVLKNYCHCL